MTTNSKVLVIPPTNAPAGTNDIRDIRGPVVIPSGWLWLALVLLAIAAAVGAFFLVRHLNRARKQSPALPPPAPPHVRARQRLTAALDQIHDPERFCVLVSGTIRTYLEERFELRAPERTTEEFLAELQGSALLNTDQKLTLGGFLLSCDLVKFARQQLAETELRRLWDSAMRLVEETSPSALPVQGTQPPSLAVPGGPASRETLVDSPPPVAR